MSKCLEKLNVSSLEQMREKRRNWVVSNRDNGFDEGINNLLTQLYPDNAHFIYELLQNAEDTRATVVRFTLSDSAVEFEHNGEKLFSLEDICSITSIGNSTKRDEPTSIGKFGVGFKAVFAYTNAPEIHSGDFHFRIHDLVVPETEGVSRHKIGDRETRFAFPFDNPKKPQGNAVGEIERGLRALGDNTLLFLNHIRKIEYLLPDGSLGILDRIEHQDGRIEIRASQPAGDEMISHWLQFDKDVEVTDEEGKLKTCRIAIAFSLVSDEGKIDQPAWKIAPLKRGQVSIYFPAEKETSNLRFHIHAPFASTVARDSVRNCRANDQLMKHIAELVAESIASIRDQGMLTVEFLAVLPNRSDQLTSFYQPIRNHIIQAFKNNDLTPTRRGHAQSTSLYRGPVKIADVINDDDLSLLTGFAPPLWAANPRQQNQLEDQFLKSLDIEDWGWSELCGAISELEDDARDKVEQWISTKEDVWLMRFYALLGEASDTHNKYIDVEELRIVRVATAQAHEHVIPKQAYFPQGESSVVPGIHFVKTSVYLSGATGSQQRLSESFLKQIGVTTFNERAVIELSLEQYNQPAEQIKPSYFLNIKNFIAYWKKTPSDVELFKGYPFLLGYSDDQGFIIWSKPSQLCLDAPYIETGLAEVTSIHKKFALCDEYKNNLSDTECKDFIEFSKAIGVMYGLTVTKVDIQSHPNFRQFWGDFSYAGITHTGINIDYSISDLSVYLKKKSIAASRLVWKAILSAPTEVSKSRFSPNKQHNYHPCIDDSHLVHLLKTSKWIPDTSGAFCEPQDIEMHELRKDFPYDEKNGLLTAIGFGGCAKERKEENRAKEESAKAAGFSSAKEMDDLKKIRDFGIPLAEIIAQLEQRQRVAQPEDSVRGDPVTRQRKVLANTADAPSKESVMLERSTQKGISEVTAQARAYLRTKCKNADGQLVCQCCHEEMPFKLPTGEHYFEAVQCIGDKETRHFQNRLALCPTCAAMYQYARETDGAEIRRSIVDHEAPDTAKSVEIPVRLAGRQFQLRFVGTHWFDLKTVLDHSL